MAWHVLKFRVTPVFLALVLSALKFLFNKSDASLFCNTKCKCLITWYGRCADITDLLFYRYSLVTYALFISGMLVNFGLKNVAVIFFLLEYCNITLAFPFCYFHILVVTPFIHCIPCTKLIVTKINFELGSLSLPIFFFFLDNKVLSCC